MTGAGTAGVERRTNWSGTYTYRAGRLRRPRSVDELSAMVTAADRIRPLGTRHSFNGAADTDGDQISVADLPVRIEIDEAGRTATVSAGLSYAHLGPVLQAAGFALPALASLPHLSIAGACATASHGSGSTVGNLATQVSGLEFVDGAGRSRRLTRNDHPDDLPGAVVSVGSLGIATAVTLDLVPTYDVAQTVYLDLPRQALIERFASITGAAYSVSCFTRWLDAVEQIWVKARAGDPDPDSGALAGAHRAPTDVHPVPGGRPADCNPQRGIPGPWHERLPHFRADGSPSHGDEIQSEFFVAAADAPDAARALFGIGPRIAAALRISEIRTVAADDLWLSPARGRDVVGFHFTWTSDASAVLPAVEIVERSLDPFRAVPHWGKVFTTRSGPRATDDPRFPGLGAFAGLSARHDPDRRFVNDYSTRWHLR